jgi:hypothetical protein
MELAEHIGFTFVHQTIPTSCLARFFSTSWACDIFPQMLVLRMLPLLDRRIFTDMRFHDCDIHSPLFLKGI